jgi:hypothetical protein
MTTSPVTRRLEIRSYFFEGLYALMTSEERRYFWGKEIIAAIGSTMKTETCHPAASIEGAAPLQGAAPAVGILHGALKHIDASVLLR